SLVFSCTLIAGRVALLPSSRGHDRRSWRAVECSYRSCIFFFKQKTAYDIGLGIPAEPLFRSPPNLGGFFMVRSYYPSECHADYFDFERIEALKPAIEACGISTLSQSPMLGFHKQMDNRIKLLEEILSFRMQGVEFDNGDMY